MADRAHSTSRRALLAGLTTSTLLTLPALAAAPHPDAGLLDLERRWIPAAAAYDAAVERVGDIEDAGGPKAPDTLLVRDGDAAFGFAHLASETHDGRRWYFLEEVTCGRALRRRQTRTIDVPPPPGHALHGTGETLGKRVLWPEAQARADEIVAAWDGWRAAVVRAEDESGLAAAQAEMSRLGRALLAIEDAIRAATPASFSGLAVKARLYQHAIACDEDVDGAVEILVRDILALQAAA